MNTIIAVFNPKHLILKKPGYEIFKFFCIFKINGDIAKCLQI